MVVPPPRRGKAASIDGLSYGQIAERAGLSKSGVARAFDGSRWPTRRTLMALAQALRVTPARIVALIEDALKQRRRKR